MAALVVTRGVFVWIMVTEVFLTSVRNPMYPDFVWDIALEPSDPKAKSSC